MLGLCNKAVYIWITEGWLYLAALKNLYTKYIELFYNQLRIQKGLDFKTPN